MTDELLNLRALVENAPAADFLCEVPHSSALLCPILRCLPIMGATSNLPTIAINIVSRDDDGVTLSLPAFAKVPTGTGWHELTRDEDETGPAFMERVRQCEARQPT